MKNLKYTLFIFLGLMVFIGCSPSTNITATWKNPDLSESGFNNILVTAMVNNVSARESLETELALQLSKKGVLATQGMNLFPPDLRDEKMGSKSELLNAINENKFDALITINLVESEMETRYVPGTTAYAPLNSFGYYGNFWGYYNYWYPTVYDPGYYDTVKSYFLETNLYDAETEKLIWSAQSETVSPGTIENLSEDYSNIITRKLMNEGLISANSNGSEM
ncbi:DUF4136 domain-containing protein [Marivirga sp.]|uniref:DUF4136 domain-containing protein n=1 Tax=Marivirga sp. TaxID=2018662 RepID=UPI002D7F65A1|nr:hypothetical protein [Marivirga sp.]HET8858939.1 hypothetical protein [Marivirga sp.]